MNCISKNHTSTTNSLINKYNELIETKEIYYNDPPLPNAILNTFDDVSFEKIKHFFISNGKHYFFDNEEEYYAHQTEGEKRCKHAFSTYLLGVFCYKHIPSIKRAFKELCEKIYQDMNEAPSQCNEDVLCKEFLYLWYPAALYHDIGYCYEKPDKNIVRSANYVRQTNIIQHERIMDKDNIGFFKESLAIPKELIEIVAPYFKKRLEGFFTENKCVDHGFAGGLKLYQKMRKAHYDKNNSNISSPQKNEPDRLLKYDPKIFKWYNTKSAWAIICHNIYMLLDNKENCKKVEKYIEKGFGDIVYMQNESFIKLSNHPLLFLLDFVDTLDPFKQFGIDGLDYIEVDTSIDNKLKICVTGCKRQCCPFAKKTLKKISSDLDFLKSDTFSVEVDEGDNSITFSFGQASH